MEPKTYTVCFAYDDHDKVFNNVSKVHFEAATGNVRLDLAEGGHARIAPGYQHYVVTKDMPGVEI